MEALIDRLIILFLCACVFVYVSVRVCVRYATDLDSSVLERQQPLSRVSHSDTAPGCQALEPTVNIVPAMIHAENTY